MPPFPADNSDVSHPLSETVGQRRLSEPDIYPRHRPLLYNSTYHLPVSSHFLTPVLQTLTILARHFQPDNRRERLAESFHSERKQLSKVPSLQTRLFAISAGSHASSSHASACVVPDVTSDEFRDLHKVQLRLIASSRMTAFGG